MVPILYDTTENGSSCFTEAKSEMIVHRQIVELDILYRTVYKTCIYCVFDTMKIRLKPIKVQKQAIFPKVFIVK